MGQDLDFPGWGFWLWNSHIWVLYFPFRFEKQAPSKAKLKEEIELLQSVLLKHDCPVVFCHNDLLCKNIVYDETKGNLK